MSTERQVYDYFLGRGFAPHQAAAWAAHTMRESGGRHDVVREWDRGRESPSIAPHSFGVSQWNDTRLANLVDFARRQGREIPAGSLRDTAYVNQLGRHIPLQTQLDFAWHEMQGPERRATDAVRGARTVEDALSAAMGYYRPAGWTPSTPTMGLGYQPALATAQRLMRTAGERPAPVSATVSGLPPDPMRDESRPAFMDTAIAPRPRDESRPTIFSGIMPGYRDGGAVAADIRRAVRETNTNPTDAQKEAGNYAKGKVRILGLEIAIENPKGSTRSGTDKNGKTWRCVLPAHYGDIKRTLGSDGDAVDCYIGDTLDSDQVWVVDQIDTKSGRFDEHKCLLCFPSRTSALASYEKAFSDGRGKDRIGSVTQFSVSDFKDWLRHGNTRKPAAVAARSGTMGRVGQAAERLARFRGGRVGYADGGAPVEDPLSTMDFTPMTQRSRPPSVLPLNHPDEARRTDSALGDLAHRVSPSLGGPVGDLEGLAGTVVGAAADFSGVPMAASAGRHMAEAMERGDPMRGAGAAGEAALAALPAFSFMRPLRALMPTSFTGRMAFGTGVGGLGVPIALSDAAEAQTASQAAPPADNMTRLIAQRETLNDQTEAARALRERERRSGTGPRFEAADAEFKKLSAQLTALDRTIAAERERQTPEYQSRVRRAEAADADRERLVREAVTERDRIRANAPKPFNEAYPNVAAAIPYAPIALGLGTGALWGLSRMRGERSALNEWNNVLDRASTTSSPRIRQEMLDQAGAISQSWPHHTLLDKPLSYAAPMTVAGIEGAMSQHFPYVYNRVMLPEENPERTAQQAYYRMLPEDHPDRARTRALLDDESALPHKNPPAMEAREQLQPGNLLARSIGPALEGAAFSMPGTSIINAARPHERALPRARTDAMLSNQPPRDITRLTSPAPSLPALPPPPAASPLPARALEPPAASPASTPPRLAPEAAPPSATTSSESPTVLFRTTDSRGRTHLRNERGNFTTDPRRAPSGEERPRRGRRTKGPDDDITPEKDGGRVNRADGGNVLTRAVDAFRRFMGGRAEYADGGAPDASEYTDVTDRGLNRAMVMDRMGVDIDAPFTERVAQGFRHELPNMARDAGLALGQRVAPMAPRPSQPSLIRVPEPRPSVTAADVAAIRGPEAVGEMALNSGIRSMRPPSTTSPMDPSYLYGLRDFHRMQAGTMHADGGAVSARANGGPVVSGPIVGPTGGREDALPVSVRSGSYVLPADTVAALGEGNTLKGMEVLKARFGGAIAQRANGGPAQEVPILISDGEYVVTPEHVMELGRGDMAAGHKALDAFVKQTRAKQISTLKGLPGPAKS